MEERIPHEEESRDRFDEAAEKASNLISGAPFFFACILLVLVWLPSVWLVGSEPAQFLLQTVIAVATLLMVALLQNSQKRSEEAVNIKLDAVAQGVADLMRYHMGEDDKLSDNVKRLAQSVGLEERLSSGNGRSVAER